MAIKLPAFLTANDTKSRLILFGLTVGLVSALVYGASVYFSSGTTTGAASVASAPQGLQSVPGSQLSPEYYRALQEANQQAAKQAQISGGSAVPTLVNVPGQQAPANFGQQQAGDCTVVCPSPDAADVSDEVGGLLKAGKINQDQATQLLALAKNNVSTEEYADALDPLVRQGKLTPEQARKLLDEYKKQHANALLLASGQTMDALIKSGKLPLDAATVLLALQKQNLPTSQYADTLNDMVADGKMTPDTATQLLAQYSQQKAQEATKANSYQLAQMAKAGQITNDVAKDLVALQQKNVPVSQYAAEISRLVAAGKMTPGTGAKLLEQYQSQRAATGAANGVGNLVATAETQCATEINGLVNQGKLSAEIAAGLLDLRKRGVTTQEYAAAVNQLVQNNKLALPAAQMLMACYQKLHDLKVEADKLIALQGNNTGLAEYTDELRRAVSAGIISPDAAARLLQEYQASLTPVIVGATAAGTTETNVAGSQDFANLQRRLQEQQAAANAAQGAAAATGANLGTAGTSAQEFENAIAQQRIEEANARRERVQALMATMQGQAQQLINAWAPPTMQHREGSAATQKSGTSASGGPASARLGGGDGAAAGAAGATGNPIIKSGTIFFAVLDTEVNSDYPDTPVMATIIAGPFKGARVLGKLSLAQGQDKVSLNFNTMDMEDWAKTKSINAFAIDPDTARTVLATNVDHHYLLRYGSIIGTSFLTGYANAITTSASTSTTGIFGTSTTHPNLSPASKIAVGLGQVGTTLGSAVSNYVNTPNTVKVRAGVGIGVLFMSDVT